MERILAYFWAKEFKECVGKRQEVHERPGLGKRVRGARADGEGRKPYKDGGGEEDRHRGIQEQVLSACNPQVQPAKCAGARARGGEEE